MPWASESSRLQAWEINTEAGFLSEEPEENTPRLAVKSERVPHNSPSSRVS